MKKADIYFWTDVTIGLAFVASAVSGIVFLLPISGDRALGIGLDAWNTLHTWSSLAVVAGVVGHLALHWNWVTTMTRKNITARRQTAPAATGQPPVNSGRRTFLRYAVAGAALAGLAAVSASLLRDDDSVASAAANDRTEERVAEGPAARNTGFANGRLTVACRRGVVYCPYPGRCHSFRDRDGDGYCDLSIPT